MQASASIIATKKQFQSLEVLRFVAAMSVVFVHMPFMGYGSFGVDIFFIISGFVMMVSTEKGGDQFFTKRLIRVLPTYYIFTLGVFAIALLFPAMLNSTTANTEHLIKSLLFIPFDKNGEGHYPLLFLGWTLNYEMFFYLIFAISLKISHAQRGLVTAMFIGAIYLLCHQDISFPFQVYGDPIVFEFTLGMMVYYLLVSRDYRSSAMMGAGLALLLWASDAHLDHRFFVNGLPSLILVMGVLVAFKKVAFPAFLLTLGGASYALYLTHPYLIQFFDKQLNWFPENANGTLNPELLIYAMLTTMAIVNGVAVLLYKYLESPIRRQLRARFIK